jgi:hypothetical protein
MTEIPRISPNKSEIKLHKQMFNSAAKMGGTRVSIRQVASATITGVSSEVFEYQEPIEVDIVYDQRPKVSLLKRYNWYSEDPSIQPQIMYIPSEDTNGNPISIRRGTLVTVPNGINSPDEATFMVSEVRTELVAIYFICNIVPWRDNLSPVPESGVNRKWLTPQ